MQTIKYVIDILVASATIFNLFFIWLTLKEMKIQRYKAFEPYILPLNFNIFLLSKYPIVLLPIDTYTTFEDILNNKTARIFIQLKNIGQGVAKDISIKIDWNVPYKEYFELIKTELLKANTDLNIHISDMNCWISDNEEKNIFTGGNYPFETSYKNDFDYLLSLKDNDNDIKVNIPSSLECLLELTILLMEVLPDNNKELIFKRLQTYFRPTINIHYKDNLDNSFTSFYSILIKSFTITTQSGISGKVYKLFLERLK